MKKIQIKSERQNNGLWGTPFNCTYMSYNTYLKDIDAIKIILNVIM